MFESVNRLYHGGGSIYSNPIFTHRAALNHVQKGPAGIPPLIQEDQR